MKIFREFGLAQIFWYKIGGKARYLLECKNREDIFLALDFIEKNQVEKIFICGLGSNLIFTDEYFDGVVIQIADTAYYSSNDPAQRGSKEVSKEEFSASSNNKIFLTNKGLVEVFAGVNLDDVIQFSFANNLVGLEWAGGLPGTVGAAVRGNVGAFGGEIKDSVFAADILDYETKSPILKTLSNENLQFVYRGSLIKTHRNMIVISATFQLQHGSDEEVKHAREIYARNIQYRKDHHPLEYPNCGSVFKNLRDKKQTEKVLSVYPELKENVEAKWHGKIAAASLIERIGLKGYRIGDAQISEKHALFIINLGNAKAKDVLRIIHDIQEKFREKFGFLLETEAEIVV